MCGIVTTNDKHSLRERLESILALMRHEDWYIESRHFDALSGIAMGRMSLGFVNTAPQPARIENGQLLAVMDGELYDAASLRADLRSAVCPVTGESHAELLLHGYRLQGQAFFRNLHGSFTAAIRFLSILGDRKRLELSNCFASNSLGLLKKRVLLRSGFCTGRVLDHYPNFLTIFPSFNASKPRGGDWASASNRRGCDRKSACNTQ